MNFDDDELIVLDDGAPPDEGDAAPPSPSAASGPLFRPEVLAERNTQWLGTVLLAPRLSHRLFVLFALAATATLVAGLLAGSYSRKARVDGWLVPRGGLVQVFAPGPGLVLDVRVVEGQEVKQGEPLFVLTGEVDTARGATRVEVARRLTERRDSLILERVNVEELAAQRAGSLGDRLAALEREQAQLDHELRLTAVRVDMAARTLARQRALVERGLAPAADLEAAEEQRLEHETRRCGLERARAAVDRERLALEHDLEELPMRTLGETLALERTIAELEQELTENEARREVVVTAPVDGTVTSLQVARGDQPRPDAPLLGLLPAGAELEAHLFCPSRAVGQLRQGQRVLVRYEAFPHQRWGQQEGLVVDVSRAALNPGELPRVAGLTSLFDPAQPLYRVRVRLARRAVTTTGHELALRPGLQLEADIVVDRRRLVEWAFEPLETLAARFK